MATCRAQTLIQLSCSWRASVPASNLKAFPTLRDWKKRCPMNMKSKLLMDNISMLLEASLFQSAKFETLMFSKASRIYLTVVSSSPTWGAELWSAVAFFSFGRGEEIDCSLPRSTSKDSWYRIRSIFRFSKAFCESGFPTFLPGDRRRTSTCNATAKGILSKSSSNRSGVILRRHMQRVKWTSA